MNAAARLRLMVARGLVNLINDAGGLQRLQVEALDNEPLDGVERVQNFGHTSHPPRGSMPVLVAVAGSRDHMVAVAVDNEEHRPRDLKEGESAMYNAHGVKLLFDQDGNATLSCKKFIIDASDGIQANTPLANFSQALTVNGMFSFKAGLSGAGGGQMTGNFTHAGGSFISNGITLHTHFHGYVQPGNGNSGEPQ